MTTCDTSRAHQSKEGTRSRSNAASAQVNNEASYANVRSDVMQAAYEAGLAGAKVHRLKCVRAQLQRHHPDLDLRGLAPEVLFKNMSPADIDALDEAAFQASIDEWKRANDILVVSNAGSIAGRTDHSRRPKKAEGAKPRGASTSDYHGVSAAPSKKNPWQARVRNPVSLGGDGKCKSIGLFPTEKEAAMAVDDYLYKTFPEKYAAFRANFPRNADGTCDVSGVPGPPPGGPPL